MYDHMLSQYSLDVKTLLGLLKNVYKFLEIRHCTMADLYRPGGSRESHPK
jgi:hypothetical protein